MSVSSTCVRCVIAVALLANLSACVRSARSTDEPTARPGARSGHSLIYDRVNDRTLLLFGYSGANLPPRSEIWARQGASWSIVDRAGPGFRSLAGVAIDDADGKLFVFGGAGPGYQTRYGDSWTWMRGEWTQRVGTGPGPTDHHAATYDQRRRNLISFGGNDPLGGWPKATWALDSSGWRIAADSVSGPPPRAHHAMAYDAARGRVVLFGGLATDRSYLNDTWEWDGVRWQRIELSGPPARTRHRMAFDVARGVVVLYGGAGVRPPGQTSGFNLLSDVWEYDGRAWRNVALPTSGPGKRMMHAMTYDAASAETLLFGGSDGVADRNDLWSWNGSRWLER